MHLVIPVGPGELFDKISILQLKLAHFEDPAKRAHVAAEREMLQAVADSIPASERLDGLVAALAEINGRLWAVEDALRDHERTGDFGPDFVGLARSVYALNDQRAQAKKRINVLLGATLIEEKEYGRGGG